MMKTLLKGIGNIMGKREFTLVNRNFSFTVTLNKSFLPQNSCQVYSVVRKG